MIVGILRNAETPLSAKEIVQSLVETGRFGEGAEAGLMKRVQSNLDYLAKQSRVSKLGERRDVRWC